MAVRQYEVYTCDRCGGDFEPKAKDLIVQTLAIGWFKYRNGSGSKTSTRMGRTWENLDHDLCPPCTTAFFAWWQKGKEQS